MIFTTVLRTKSNHLMVNYQRQIFEGGELNKERFPKVREREGERGRLHLQEKAILCSFDVAARASCIVLKPLFGYVMTVLTQH